MEVRGLHDKRPLVLLQNIGLFSKINKLVYFIVGNYGFCVNIVMQSSITTPYVHEVESVQLATLTT